MTDHRRRQVIDDRFRRDAVDSLRPVLLRRSITFRQVKWRDVNGATARTFIWERQRVSILRRGIAMNKFYAVSIAALFSISAAHAQTSAPAASSKAAAPAAATQSASSSCETQAVGKNGKPLTGAAKSSFMKKCEGSVKSAASTACEAKAVGKDGKPLAGAAKASFMKKCEAGAGS
jgi:hypothetical protein